MNPNQKLFLRVTHHGEVTQQLEVPDLRGAMMHIFDSFKDAPHRKVLMNIEIGNHPFASSLLTREQELEQAIQHGALTNLNDIIYPPDVTLADCFDAWQSTEGELMFRYQRAENRIGVDPEKLNEIRQAYESKFPRVAIHGPKWAKS
jgi:hypothetical protein